MNMHKIYSRPRIKIPIIRLDKKINDTKKTINRLKVLLILVTIIVTVKIVFKIVYPIFDTLSESKAKSIATIISNEEATRIMKEHTYDELFIIEKDQNNNIEMIKSNIIKINEITSSIAENIQKRINDSKRENIEIAIRKFYGG